MKKQPMTIQEIDDLNLNPYDFEECINDERTWDLDIVPREVLVRMLEMVKDEIKDLNRQRSEFHDNCPRWYDNYIFPMDCTESEIQWAIDSWEWDDNQEVWVKAQEEDSEE